MYLAVSSHHSGRSLRPISGSSLHTSRFNSHGSYSPQCAVKMYTGATVDELNSHCAFRCNESQAMIISEVQDDVYVITHPQPMMLIQFGKSTQDIITSAVGKPGALQVHLPCNCQLRLKEDVVIPTSPPCESLNKHPGPRYLPYRPNQSSESLGLLYSIRGAQ
ncbi:hypothetical protein MTP99_006953 [Tenebrio molitor]|nr:hypothetical protein MTP99_006953 [Tenebrio molitor]